MSDTGKIEEPNPVGALLYALGRMTDEELRLLRDLLTDCQPQDVRKGVEELIALAKKKEEYSTCTRINGCAR